MKTNAGNSQPEITKDAIHRRVDSGLRNLWYPVAPSWALGADPLGMTRLGENIVLWRDTQSGNIHCLEDRCPHRGARLSLGWNLGDRIACWYHGIQMSPSGDILDVPAFNAELLVGRKCIKAYKAIEMGDAIWVYFGDGETDAPPIELPDEMTDKAYAAFLCVAKWHCCHTYAIENVADPMHGAYLHSASHSMAHGDKSADMELNVSESGFRFEKTGQTGVNFDWVEFGMTTTPWMKLAIPYGPGAGPGGDFGIVGVATPVDEHKCIVFFWRIRKVSGWQRDVWQFMYRTRLEKLHWDVLEQDRHILENLVSNARDRELLYKHDFGLVHLRKILRRTAEDQLTREREQAEKPVAQTPPASP